MLPVKEEGRIILEQWQLSYWNNGIFHPVISVMLHVKEEDMIILE